MGFQFPCIPVVRATILVMLAQILRSKGLALGLELSPATDRPPLVDALAQVLTTASPTSTGRVVAFDLETVAPDLSSVPWMRFLIFAAFILENSESTRVVFASSFEKSVNSLPEKEKEHSKIAKSKFGISPAT
jgi:hypothetical protein